MHFLMMTPTQVKKLVCSSHRNSSLLSQTNSIFTVKKKKKKKMEVTKIPTLCV